MRDSKAIKKSIVALGKASKKMDQRIHDLAVECLAHAAEHGNVTLCGLLVAELGGGVRRQDLITWFGTFGPVNINKKTFEAKKDKSSKVAYDVEGATAKPFWELTEDTPGRLTTLADIKAVIFSMPNRIKAAAEKGTYIGDAEADIAEVETYAAKLGLTSREALREESQGLKEIVTKSAA